ncbi:MAG: hypothetical protein LUH01_09365 [Parabacteroides gordonii]|nr:hypothetical protein [Parabacteroides gordonii]
MALKFRKVQRKILNGDDKGRVKTFGVAKSSGYCDMAKLCELISNRSAMSSADVKAILDSLNWAMGLELRSGNIVQVGEFGNFRLSISTQGASTEDKFSATNIKKAHIVFFPGSSLRWSNFLTTFEEDDVKVVEKKEPEDDRPVIE